MLNENYFFMPHTIGAFRNKFKTANKFNEKNFGIIHLQNKISNIKISNECLFIYF